MFTYLHYQHETMDSDLYNIGSAIHVSSIWLYFDDHHYITVSIGKIQHKSTRYST
jgi:hypothetical protein